MWPEMRQYNRPRVNPCKITYFLFRFRAALSKLTYIIPDFILLADQFVINRS